MTLGRKSILFKVGKCKHGESSKTEYYREYQYPVWADGAKPFTARSLIGGDMRIGPSSSDGSAYVWSFH